MNYERDTFGCLSVKKSFAYGEMSAYIHLLSNVTENTLTFNGNATIPYRYYDADIPFFSYIQDIKTIFIQERIIEIEHHSPT